MAGSRQDATNNKLAEEIVDSLLGVMALARASLAEMEADVANIVRPYSDRLAEGLRAERDQRFPGSDPARA